ncbi:MAG: hypothetical protein E3K32_01675 [wastewater metagenome]|nr:hypothetical protein [Candidatus Loosdrechtia aerotolerans]
MIVRTGIVIALLFIFNPMFSVPVLITQEGTEWRGSGCRSYRKAVKYDQAYNAKTVETVNGKPLWGEWKRH